MSESYIGLLDPGTPTDNDFVYTGPQSVRTVKAASQASFPNVQGAVTATHTQFNNILNDSVYNGTANALQKVLTDAKAIFNPHSYATHGTNAADIGTIVPIGTILMWTTAIGSVPTGWHECDGGTYNGITVPDLRGRFIRARDVPNGLALGAYAAVNQDTAAESAHTHATSGHALTAAEIPAHKHEGPQWFQDGYTTPIDGPGSLSRVLTIPSGPDYFAMWYTGGLHGGVGVQVNTVFTNGSYDLSGTAITGASHTHGNTAAGSAHSHTNQAGNMPINYALIFICYTGA